MNHFFTFFVVLCIITIVAAYLPARQSFPAIISHRGASGYLPEHSLQAYQLAIDLKTDYIEPDLCLSKDGVFVAMHDILLDDTTNVASFPKFSDRYTTKVVDGVNTTGYFISDFTYSELQELSLNQRMDIRTDIYDGYFKIPTFTQIMDLAQSTYKNTGRMVGIYPELKHPSFFHNLGWKMEDLLLKALQDGGYDITNAPNSLKEIVPVVIQCFELDTLKYLRPLTNIPLIYLVEKADQAGNFWSEENFTELAKYIDGVGPEKSPLANAEYKEGLHMMELLHNAGLGAHPYTFRADSGINKKFNGDFNKENLYFYCCLGMDGLFTEFADRSRESIDSWRNHTAWNEENNISNPQLCPIDCESP